MCLETIKKIKGFDVTFLVLTSFTVSWINAYVRLDNVHKDKIYENQSYRNGEVFGVDTVKKTHLNIEEKMIDCERQIGELIESYLNDSVNKNVN